MATSGSRDFEPDVAEYIEERHLNDAVLSFAQDMMGSPQGDPSIFYLPTGLIVV